MCSSDVPGLRPLDDDRHQLQGVTNSLRRALRTGAVLEGASLQPEQRFVTKNNQQGFEPPSSTPNSP